MRRDEGAPRERGEKAARIAVRKRASKQSPLASRSFRVLAACNVISLTPLVAHARLGGAGSWGLIVAAYSAGAVAGGLVLIRYRPRRQLRAAVAAVPAFSVLLFALAAPLRWG